MENSKSEDAYLPFGGGGEGEGAKKVPKHEKGSQTEVPAPADKCTCTCKMLVAAEKSQTVESAAAGNPPADSRVALIRPEWTCGCPRQGYICDPVFDLRKSFPRIAKAVSLVLFYKKHSKPNYVYILCIKNDLEGYRTSTNTSGECIFRSYIMQFLKSQYS